MPVVDTSHGKYVGLKRGMRGPYVKNLQRRLRNVLTGKDRPSVDGSFGPGTEKSLKAFQEKVKQVWRDMPVTGVVDEATDKALFFAEMGSSEGPVRAPEPKEINLAQHEKRNIGEYCKVKGRAGDASLHCAHWVSHLLEYPRAKCGYRSVGHYGKKANDWIAYDPDNPNTFNGKPRLIYVAWRAKGSSSPFRLRGSSMTIRQPRHIGILLGKSIFHYENKSAYECVMRSPSDRTRVASRFIDRYHYKGVGECEHWTSALPSGMLLNISDRPGSTA